MRAVVQPARDWFVGLTARERVLVAIGGALAALVVLIYGIVLPLGSAHDAAHVRHREAVVATGRVLARLEALDNAPEAVRGANGPVAEIVTALADVEGLVLQANTARGNDEAQISVPTAAPGAALAFLDGLRQRGIAARQVTITPAADGSVSLNTIVVRAGT